MKLTKVISIVSACVAVVSISTAVLMMRQKDEDTYIPELNNSASDNELYDDEEQPYIEDGDYISDYSKGQTKPKRNYEKLELPVYEYVPNNSGMTEHYKMLMKQNNDIVGWLRINNTQVDYPLLKDPGDVIPNTGYGSEAVPYNEYYLKHNFNREWTFDGNIFMDCRDDLGAVEELQSDNIVIYGHNMLNGSQFGNLRLYREGGYYQSNPFVYLSSIYKDYAYVIVSFCITSGNGNADFLYWDMEEFEEEEDFDYYVNTIKSKQLLDTGVDIEYGDKLLTLSTCHSDIDNSRFIILARRLREGEVAGSFSTIEKVSQ